MWAHEKLKQIIAKHTVTDSVLRNIALGHIHSEV